MRDNLSLSMCLTWRKQARYVREHAEMLHLQPEQRAWLMLEAANCDKQADWWLNGAIEYLAPGIHPYGRPAL